MVDAYRPAKTVITVELCRCSLYSYQYMHFQIRTTQSCHFSYGWAKNYQPIHTAQPVNLKMHTGIKCLIISSNVIINMNFYTRIISDKGENN